MERIETIEESKMIKRLVGQFGIYSFLYGLLYIAYMVIFIIIAICLEETFVNTMIMCVVNLAVNLGFMVILSRSSICNAFEGINTVDVPNKSRRRILKIATVIVSIFMAIATILNIITLHSLVTSKFTNKEYQINSESSLNEIVNNARRENGIFTTAELINSNEGMNVYNVSSRIYSKEAITVFIVMTVMNVFVIIAGAFYENNLLKRYLIPQK